MAHSVSKQVMLWTEWDIFYPFLGERPMKSKLLYATLSLFLLFSCFGCTPRYEKYRSEFTGLFDTYTIIIGYAQSEAEFTRYAEAIYNRMQELNSLYDIYNAYEGINNLYTINQNAGVSPVKVSRDIIDMLLVAREAYQLSNGAVNIAMGPVLKIWHGYRVEGIANEESAQLPPMEMLLEAKTLTDINDVIIDEANDTVYLCKAGMSLDVGAIAKGYAAEQAAKAAREAGATSLLLNAGGNITSIGKPLDNVRDRWGIGIQDADLSINGTQNIMDTVFVNDMTLSCSGDYQRFYTVDGIDYHHIIDPETLMPANHYKQVTVLHPEAGTADYLSTALFIMTQEEGAVLAEQAGAQVLWVYRDGQLEATDGYVQLSKNLGNYSAVE